MNVIYSNYTQRLTEDIIIFKSFRNKDLNSIALYLRFKVRISNVLRIRMEQKVDANINQNTNVVAFVTFK